MPKVPVFIIPCMGDEECKTLWPVPITELKKEMNRNSASTLEQLARGYVCSRCRVEFERMIELPDMRVDNRLTIHIDNLAGHPI